MRTSMKIYPEMRKKSKKDNLIPFYLRIIHNGIKSEGRLNPNTAVSEKSLKYWHQPTQQFSKEIGEWNNDIAEIKEAFREITRNKSKCRSLSAKQIKDYLMEDTPTINRTLIEGSVRSIIGNRNVPTYILTCISIYICNRVCEIHTIC